MVFSKSSLKMSFATQSPTLSMPNGEPISQSVYLLSANLEISKTVTALDVVYALKRSGRTLYGFGA